MNTKVRDSRGLTQAEIAIKLHEQYGFMQSLSHESIRFCFSTCPLDLKYWPDNMARKEGKNVASLIAFCAEKLIRFTINSRVKDRACTNANPQKLEYMVNIERDFTPGCTADCDSQWNGSLQRSFIQALYGCLLP